MYSCIPLPGPPVCDVVLEHQNIMVCMMICFLSLCDCFQRYSIAFVVASAVQVFRRTCYQRCRSTSGTVGRDVVPVAISPAKEQVNANYCQTFFSLENSISDYGMQCLFDIRTMSCWNIFYCRNYLHTHVWNRLNSVNTISHLFWICWALPYASFLDFAESEHIMQGPWLVAVKDSPQCLQRCSSKFFYSTKHSWNLGCPCQQLRMVFCIADTIWNQYYSPSAICPIAPNELAQTDLDSFMNLRISNWI